MPRHTIAIGRIPLADRMPPVTPPRERIHNDPDTPLRPASPEQLWGLGHYGTSARKKNSLPSVRACVGLGTGAGDAMWEWDWRLGVSGNREYGALWMLWGLRVLGLCCALSFCSFAMVPLWDPAGVHSVCSCFRLSCSGGSLNSSLSFFKYDCAERPSVEVPGT